MGSNEHYDVHAAERSRNEEARDSRGLSSERDQSKWEYMGYGIWENRDPEEYGSEESPPPTRRWSAERGVQSMNSVQQTFTNQKSYHNRSYSGNMDNDNGGSASNATAGRVI